MQFFLFVKFATSLLALLAGGQNEQLSWKEIIQVITRVDHCDSMSLLAQKIRIFANAWFAFVKHALELGSCNLS